MKKIVLLCLLGCLACSAIAQETKSKKEIRRDQKRKQINEIARQEEEGIIKYNKHFAGGLKLNSDGYGIFLEKAKAQSVKKALLFQLEISERKNRKESKRQSSSNMNSTPFIPGKIQFLYPIKIGVAQSILLGNKSNKNGVSITANGGGGLSLALQRPYMVQIEDGTGNVKYVSYLADSSAYLNAFNNAAFLNGPGFSKGWSEVKFTPGAYLKAAVRFDYGRYNEMINALEVGVGAEFYSKKIPMMIYTKQQQFFFSGYVAIVFGKRK